MNIEEFKETLLDYYHGEILGEVVMEQLIKHFDEPARQAKLAVLLQLETETKARLRPHVLDLGLSLADDDKPREEALVMSQAFAGLSWDEVMAGMCEQLPPVIEHYRQVADEAPDEYRALAESMYVHEKSLLEFANAELNGERESSTKPVYDQLYYKLAAN